MLLAVNLKNVATKNNTVTWTSYLIMMRLRDEHDPHQAFQLILDTGIAIRVR